jgi:short-subunit dehydrogenase
MTFKLKQRYGQTAMVTGASSGIGKSFAQTLAAEGMDLVIVARREQALVELATELQASHGIRVTCIPQDLTALDAADNLATALNEQNIEVDLLINNAGVGTHGRFEELDLDREKAMIQLNCQLPVALAHKLLPGMKARGRGGIVMLASVAGQMPVPYMAAYSASKAFMRFFSESLWGELRGSGVDIVSISPGDTATEFRQTADLNNKFPIPPRTAQDVVNTSLKALGKKTAVVDGLMNKLTAWWASWAPRKLLILMNAKLWKV